MQYRECDCAHGFPLCAHGLVGSALWLESRRLSALAGWPGEITTEGLAVAEAERGDYSTPEPELEQLEEFGRSSSMQSDCDCGK